MKKEDLHKEIENTMQSLEGMQRAEVNPYLYTRIRARMERDLRQEALIAPALLWKIALSLVALVLLNVFSIYYLNHNTSGNSSSHASGSIINNEYASEFQSGYNYK